MTLNEIKDLNTMIGQYQDHLLSLAKSPYDEEDINDAIHVIKEEMKYLKDIHKGLQ